MERSAFRLSASAAVVASSLVLSGCFLSPASQAEQGMRNGLAEMVGESQDIVWEFRDELTADPEAALPGVWGVTDARPAYTDPDHEVPFGSWTLGLEQGAGGTALTLTTSARSESGGGLFAESRGGYTCYTLLIASDASRIDTEPSDCTDGQGHGLSDLIDTSDTRIIPLQELDVQRTVDASDHAPMPCQCSSAATATARVADLSTVFRVQQPTEVGPARSAETPLSRRPRGSTLERFPFVSGP